MAIEVSSEFVESTLFGTRGRDGSNSIRLWWWLLRERQSLREGGGKRQ